MKKKLSLLLLPSLLLSLSSCAINDFYNTIEEISIYDYRNAYFKDYKFSETNRLEVVARYKNGEVKDIPLELVNLTLIDEDDKQVDYRSSFGNGGTYRLYCYSGSVVSNLIELTVNEEDTPAESISFDISTTSIRTMDVIDFSLDVTPSNYNDEIMISFLRNNQEYKDVVSHRVDVDSYNFYDEKEGVTTIKASSENINETIDISVANAANKIIPNITYKDLSNRNAPTIGDTKLLVVPVWFKDSSSFLPDSVRGNIYEDLNSAFFSDGSVTGWQSVSSYYNSESRGKLNLQGKVSDWYFSNYYINNGDVSSSIGIDTTSLTKTRELANTIVDWYFAEHRDESRLDYDSDGDGFIDALALIYAAPDYFSYGVDNNYRNNTNLWAYCCPGSRGYQVDNPQVGTFLWASYDFMYGYSSALSRTLRPYYKGSTTNLRIDTHTYIHETGHLFGLRDYYDYSNQYKSASGFSMQDYNVGGHDPFSMFAFGWANPYLPTSSCRIKLNSFQETGDLILLTPEFNSVGSPFDEYLLLELYTPTGLNYLDSRYTYTPFGGIYPLGSKNVGVRLWHVDARLTKNTGFDQYDENLTVDPRPNGIYEHAFSNSYYLEGGNNDHISPLAKCTHNNDYAIYNLLSLIRNDTSVSHKTNKLFSDSDLFYAGNEFTMEKYEAQFPQKYIKSLDDSVLDNGKNLGWSFVIESITDNSAIINLTRL